MFGNYHILNTVLELVFLLCRTSPSLTGYLLRICCSCCLQSLWATYKFTVVTKMAVLLSHLSSCTFKLLWSNGISKCQVCFYCVSKSGLYMWLIHLHPSILCFIYMLSQLWLFKIEVFKVSLHTYSLFSSAFRYIWLESPWTTDLLIFEHTRYSGDALTLFWWAMVILRIEHAFNIRINSELLLLPDKWSNNPR